jgi:hypothetical protein
LLDPDPAVTRAGLVDQVAEKLSAHRLDRIGACLTSDSPTVTAFAKVYTVWDVLPLRWSKITAWMRSHQVGRCTVIRRGPAGVSEDAPRGLKLQGSRHVYVVLTMIDGCPKAILCNHIQETQTDYS